MKKLLTIASLILLASCGAKESENEEPDNILENLTYSVDTVIMDAGEDIFNLAMGIRSPDLSQDEKTLYYFENRPPKLLQVDLESSRLLGKTDFEEEGPNGVGSFVSKIQVGPDGNLFINGNAGIGIFDPSGTKIQDLRITPEGIDPDLAKNFFRLYGNSIYDWENESIYSWPLGEDYETIGLTVIDVPSQAARIIDAPEMDIVQKYSLTAQENNSYMGAPQRVYLTKQGGRIFITCSAMGDLYEYDPQRDSIRFIVNKHKLIPDRLTGEVNNKLTSQADFLREMGKINSQIIYLAPAWDPSRDLFFRLAMKVFPGDTPDDPSKYEYYLLSYDQEFKLLGESKLDLKERVDYSHFFKDGKLYSYVNVEDELGFAVFTFDF